MKKLTAILLALVCVISLAACAKKTDSDLEYVKGNGKLIIGITEYEPMNYYDAGGKLVGFDTEFAEAVCAKLGVTPQFQVIEWSAKETELKGKTIDCIWNGLTVTEERRTNMDFTSSYLCNEQVLVVRAEDAAGFPDTASFEGKTVVAEEKSAGETAILADITGANYVPVSAQSSALLEVKAGTADAAVIDLTMARSMTGEGTEYSDLAVLNIPLTNEEYAIGFRLGSDITAEVDKIIKELISDGTIRSLAEKYGVSDLLIG